MSQNPQKSILIVEDDADIRESIADLLSIEGYEVYSANHGEQALSILKSGVSVRLILLDLMMPVMDGFQFREEILKWEKFSKIPILIMSADGNLKQKLERVGAKNYLKKPLDVDDLVRAVEVHTR